MISTYLVNALIIDRKVEIYFINLDIRPEKSLTFCVGTIKTLRYRRNIEGPS